MKINSLYCIRSVLTLVFRINGQGLISVQGGRISIQGIPAFRDFTIRPLFRDSVLGLNFVNSPPFRDFDPQKTPKKFIFRKNFGKIFGKIFRSLFLFYFDSVFFLFLSFFSNRSTYFPLFINSMTSVHFLLPRPTLYILLRSNDGRTHRCF